MLTTNLLEKLLDIERAVGLADCMTVRKMLMELETQVMQLQQELVFALDEVHQLREEREPVAPRFTPGLPRVAPFQPGAVAAAVTRKVS